MIPNDTNAADGQDNTTLVDSQNDDDLVAAENNLSMQVEQLTATNSDLSLQVETLTEANAKLAADLDAARNELAVKPKGKVTAVAAPKLRKAGPIAEAKVVEGDALTELMAAADEGDVVIVFSDGKSEIDGVPALVVSGDVWRQHNLLGRMLRDPVTLVGATKPTQLVGYALFVGGKQVAWTLRPDAINLAPGQSVQLVDDIYFA